MAAMFVLLTVFGMVALSATVAAVAVLTTRKHQKRFEGQGFVDRTRIVIGQRARVTEAIDPVLGTGRVVIGGADWAARSRGTVALGSEVVVQAVDGIVVEVEPIGVPATTP